MRPTPVLVSLLGAVAVAGAARTASAQDLGQQARYVQSPQHFALEFRFGPYWPQVDSQPGLSGTPYHDVYGGGADFYFGAEFDWQALRIPHFGTIGPALAAGYTKSSAKAQLSSGGGASQEDTNLEIFPFYGVAVLRVDVFEHDYGVPLVPYVKGGVGLALWNTSTDTGISHYQGVRGEGLTPGLQLAVGMALSLNWLDPRAALRLDTSVGINYTNLFGEWMLSNLDGFGSSSDMRVGTSTFVGGLSFDF